MQSSDLLDGASFRARFAFFAIVLGPLIALGLIFAISVKPAPLPKSALLGCYVTSPPGLAPPIYIDHQAILIGASNNKSLEYSIVNLRGYVLEVGPGNLVVPVDNNKYEFDNNDSFARYWRLGWSRATDGFDGNIAIVANNGVEIVYRRTSDPNDCKQRTNA